MVGAFCHCAIRLTDMELNFKTKTINNQASRACLLLYSSLGWNFSIRKSLFNITTRLITQLRIKKRQMKHGLTTADSALGFSRQ
jgi:hypothetical protein